MLANERAAMRELIAELNQARVEADILAHDEGNIFKEHGEIRAEAYQDALDMIARRFPNLFEVKRPSRFMHTIE